MSGIIDSMKVANAISSKIEPDVKVIMTQIEAYYKSINEQPLTEDILVASLEILSSWDYVDNHAHAVKKEIRKAMEGIPVNKRLYALFYIIQAVILNSIQEDIKNGKI